MKLYGISAHYRAIMAHIEGNGGDLDGLEEELDACMDALTEKADAIAALISEANAEAAAYKAEAERLTEGRKRAENRAERLKAYLVSNIPEEGLKTGRFALSIRRSEAVKILCEVLDLPFCYRRTKITDEADKVALKEDLKKGKVIDGAVLVERKSITIK